jgi:hypothetical protein
VLANDVAALVTAPGAAARGQLPPEQQMGLAPQLASGAFTLGMLGEAPEGAFTAFGSTQAKRMPAGVRPLGEALDRHASWAKQGLEDSVAAKDDIWRSTGWYKDVDGRWKFEIPDAGASHLRQDFLDKYAGGAFEPNPMAGDSPYTRQVKLPANNPVKLGDVLDHPTLYQAYPWLEDLPVWGKPPGGTSSKGTYHSEVKAISLSAMQPGAFRSTLHHEVQHAIQHYEDFGWGGNVNQFLPPFFKEEQDDATARLVDTVKQARDLVPEYPQMGFSTVVHKFNKGAPMTDAEWDALETLQKRDPVVFDKLKYGVVRVQDLSNKWNAAYQSYMNLAGEVESRNVQDRLAQGEAEVHPHATAGYPRGPQTVTFSGGWKGGTAPSAEEWLVPPGENPAGGGGLESFRGYHGTPHTFAPTEGAPFGEFSNEKIGSGEGAQVYGYGHYVAGRYGTAEYYRKALSRGQAEPELTLDGSKVEDDDRLPYNAQLDQNGFASPQNTALHAAGLSSGDTDKALKNLRSAVDTNKRMLADVKDNNARFGKGGVNNPYAPDAQQYYERVIGHHQNAIDWLQDNASRIGWNKAMPLQGNMLKLVVSPREEELLHWDEPLSQQSPEVQQKLQTTGLLHKDFLAKDPTGEEIYRDIGGTLRGASYRSGDREASGVLGAAGIPGIRYYDQGSRWDTPKRQLLFDNSVADKKFSKGMANNGWEDGTGPFTINQLSPGELAHGRLMQDYSPYKDPGGKMLPEALENAEMGLRTSAKEAQRMLDPTHWSYVPDLHPDTPKIYEAAADWLKKNAGKYSVQEQKRSHNYVIFDPKHIKIVGRNKEWLPNPDDPKDVGGWPW